LGEQRDNNGTHLFIAQVEEFLQLNTSVRECPEGSLLFNLSSESGVGNRGISLENMLDPFSVAIYYGAHHLACS